MDKQWFQQILEQRPSLKSDVRIYFGQHLFRTRHKRDARSSRGRSVSSGVLLGDLLLEFTYSFRLWKSFPFSAWIASATFCIEPRSTNAKHLQPFWTLWTWRGLKSFRRHRISSCNGGFKSDSET